MDGRVIGESKRKSFPAGQAKVTIIELESIRGIAAIFVVLFHIPAWNASFHDINLIRSGHIMVDLFFVLSGVSAVIVVSSVTFNCD